MAGIAIVTIDPTRPSVRSASLGEHKEPRGTMQPAEELDRGEDEHGRVPVAQESWCEEA